MATNDFAQQFGRAFRVGMNLLPFEQWEQKHRWNGKGFTRPRGKKYAAVVDRYNSGYYSEPDRDGVRTWLRNQNHTFGAHTSPDITAFSKARHGMSFDRCIPTFTTPGNGVNRQLEFYKEMIDGDSPLSIGYRIHDEMDDFPDVPGEICGDELTRQINELSGKPRCHAGQGTLSIKKDNGAFEEIGIVTGFSMKLRKDDDEDSQKS